MHCREAWVVLGGRVCSGIAGGPTQDPRDRQESQKEQVRFPPETESFCAIWKTFSYCVVLYCIGVCCIVLHYIPLYFN